MSKKLFSIILVAIIVLSSFGTGFAATKDQVVRSTKNVEITDLDVLYERAKSNQSDYKGFVLESNSMDLSRSLMNIEDNNSVLKNTKTGEILAVDTVETTQLLSEVKKIRVDGSTEITAEYATTYFAAALQRADEGWDDSAGVKAYSTIYWSEGTAGNITTVYLTKVKGGWDIDDSSISIIDKTVRIGQNGWSDSGYVGNQLVDKSPSGLSFTYYINFSKELLTSEDYYAGTDLYATLKRGGSEWEFRFENKIP